MRKVFYRAPRRVCRLALGAACRLLFASLTRDPAVVREFVPSD